MGLASYKAMAFEPRFTITNTITAALTEIERARGFFWRRRRLRMSGLTQCVRGRFCWKRIIRRTSRVRGLRWRTPTIWLAGRAVPGADPDDARELLNYRDAFAFVSSYLSTTGKLPRGTDPSQRD